MLDVKTIQSLSGARENVAKIWLPYFQKYFPEFGLTTKERISSFLSQVGHESGGLYYTQELASGSAYEGRSDLGNNVKGDGVKFKGRGLIQTTGRENYQHFKNKYGVDVINNPSLLGAKNATVATPEQLKNSLLSALYYWTKKRTYPSKDVKFKQYNVGSITPKASILDNQNLNELSDKLILNKSANNTDTIRKITQVINGGQNGIDDRLNRFQKGLIMAKEKVEQISVEAEQYAKRNWLPIALVVVGVTGLIYVGYKYRQTKLINIT